MDEKRIELKHPTTVQNGTGCFTLFCRVPGMHFYVEIYVTLKQNLQGFTGRWNFGLKIEGLRPFFISSVQGYILMYMVGFYLY